MNILRNVIFILFPIMILLGIIYICMYNKCNKTKTPLFETPLQIKEAYTNEDPYLYGTHPNVGGTKYNNPWIKLPVSNGNPYIQDVPIDHKLTLTKSLDNPFKAYNLGIIDYKKMTTPILSSKEDLYKFGKFNSIGLSPSCLHQDNKKTSKNIANEININKNIKVPYVKSQVDAVNKINKAFLKEFNNNQVLIATKELVMKNSLHEYMIYGYKVENVLSNNLLPPSHRFQIKLNLIKRESYYNPVIFVDGLYDKKSNKVYFYTVDFIGQFDTSTSLMVEGSGSSEKYKIIPANYEKADKIINSIDTIIKDRDTYLEGQKLTSQYACFNTDPGVMLSNKALYKDGKPLKEFTMLNYFDKQDCEKKYDIIGKPKKTGVWDRPCKKNEDCPYYKSNKNYRNNYGGCDKSSGKCLLPLNMVSIGYHYFYPEKEFEPLCYNCNSDEWMPSTNLNKCCEEQKNKNKYPFLKGNPDYAFKHDFQERTNSYLQNNCYLKSEGKTKVNNNIICKKGSYDMY